MPTDFPNGFPWEADIPPDKVSLWFLGQAGYYLKSGGVTIMIDPYLSDSGGRDAPRFTRAYPVPADPGRVKVGVFIVTHDHLDHLDPETVAAYSFKETTAFVAPRLAAKKLEALGVPAKNITALNPGERAELGGARIEGVFALPTGADVLDTSGYLITFPNGKSVRHTSDTAFCDLLLKACPRADVLLVCINGKFGNLGVEQAVELTRAADPRFVIPNHYDAMSMNSENPETFRYFCEAGGIEAKCVILKAMEAFSW